MKLTPADKETLSTMPDVWFRWPDLAAQVKNPEGTVHRLYKRGHLERRKTEGLGARWVKYEYRKTDKAKDLEKGK